MLRSAGTPLFLGGESKPKQRKYISSDAVGVIIFLPRYILFKRRRDAQWGGDVVCPGDAVFKKVCVCVWIMRQSKEGLKKNGWKVWRSYEDMDGFV